MPYFEMWWGSTDIPSSEGTTSLFGPAGVTVQGNVASGSHKITGHFFASPDRLGRAGIANVRCASVPVAVIAGVLDAGPPTR